MIFPRRPPGAFEESSERVIAAATAVGGPLLPPPDASVDDAIDEMAAANLARAWSIEPGAGV